MINLEFFSWFHIRFAIIASGLLQASSHFVSADEPAPNNQQKPLVVCAVPNTMPRTGKTDDGSPQGLDVAVIQMVARELGCTLDFHWCGSASCSWSCVRQRRCDVVIGQPHNSGPGQDVAWSIPYSGSRFGLVVHRQTSGIHSAADLKEKRVGVVAGSVAVASQGQTTVQFKTREELLNEFVDRELDAAFVDDDFAAWYLHDHPDLPLERVAEYVPRERWNMGVAVRSTDASLLKQINRALTSIMANGEVSKAFADRGVPYRAPFTKTETKLVSPETWKRIREHGELVVSMDPANMPYSSAKEKRPGFDVELARALAGGLGVKLRIDWIDIQRETALGQLLDGECDLAFGAAVDPGAIDEEEPVEGKVIYSVPYYGTGYFLVTRKNGPTARSLAELTGKKSRRIGTEAGSVADYRLRQRGYLRRLFRTQLAVLKSLHDGGIDYAYLWGNVGWTLHTSPEFDVQLVPDYVPEDHWNIAVAMRRGDDQLKQHVDAAIQRLIADGTVASALADYQLPYLPPFEEDKDTGMPDDKTSSIRPENSTHSNLAQESHQKVIRHAPSDRGVESLMARRQRSKHDYGGLERIRSAGVLVVGLDQNSLPFSTAHPEPSGTGLKSSDEQATNDENSAPRHSPLATRHSVKLPAGAGLDFEIAGLLAEQLGVSLNVYWAYSSHDSYPSKLANKKLCDLMLGVTPDDRFGQRVAYSKPYYFADYRFVVPADAAAPDAETPLAVERGLALRGLEGRTVHHHPSLESILNAVAEGAEQAGYVISTRGQWLAEQRWPGRLKFVRSESSKDDRFPICAALRKSDRDLADAVDRAFAELAESGKLKEVFARWYIQFESPQQ